MRSTDARLARPDRLILISPMIGITSFARFAGLPRLPAMLPAFAKAAWLGILPEFNPFKYNSFPGQRRAPVASPDARRCRSGSRAPRATARLDDMPPVLTFQSVVDFTVSTRAIISALYALLPANGSELVLFDINRAAKFGPLAAQRFRDRADAHPAAAAAQVPHDRSSPTSPPAATRSLEHVTEAGATTEQTRDLGLPIRPASSRCRTSRCRFR